LPIYVRQQLLDALIVAIASRSRDEWSQLVRNGYIHYFNQIRLEDSSPRISPGAIMALDIMLEGADLTQSLWISDEEMLDLAQLANEVSKLSITVVVNTFFADSLDALRTAWA
jgi:hypothetical protein